MNAKPSSTREQPCSAPSRRPSWPTQCVCGWLMAEHEENIAQDLEQEKAQSERCGFCDDGLVTVGDGYYEGAGCHEETCPYCDGSGRQLPPLRSAEAGS